MLGNQAPPRWSAKQGLIAVSQTVRRFFTIAASSTITNLNARPRRESATVSPSNENIVTLPPPRISKRPSALLRALITGARTSCKARQASIWSLNVGAHHAAGKPCRTAFTTSPTASVVLPKRLPRTHALNRFASASTWRSAGVRRGKLDLDGFRRVHFVLLPRVEVGRLNFR